MLDRHILRDCSNISEAELVFAPFLIVVVILHGPSADGYNDIMAYRSRKV